MRKFFTAIMIVSAPLALAACGEKAAEPEETIVAEETVTEEPATVASTDDNATGQADAAEVSADAEATEASDVTENDAEAK